MSGVKFVCLHHLPAGVHELDGAGKVGAGVDESRGRDHEAAVIVLNLVLEECGYPDVDVLEEVEY